jgi:uncharacterized protein (DUF362 family)
MIAQISSLSIIDLTIQIQYYQYMALLSRISVVETDDRAEGVPRAVRLLNIPNPAQGKSVFIKPNFNTADPFPASTHPETLEAIVELAKEMGPISVTVGDRSGPADTAEVMRDLGVSELCARQSAALMNLEELPADRWERINPPGSHWRDGFLFARPVMDAGCVVTTCCLKTHGFGAVFTMSLKLTIGAVHGENMNELHTSFRSMRKMIAEANTAYTPSLIVMDAMEAFTDKGPMSGPRKHAGLIVAGTDRVALDAVGLAILKDLGSNRAIMDTPIFAQEQISRAVELGLGASSPAEIDLVHDEGGAEAASRIRSILDKG